MDADQLAWRKSSASGAFSTSCVELARDAWAMLVRDSKNRLGPLLAFDLSDWRVFLDELCASDLTADGCGGGARPVPR